MAHDYRRGRAMEIDAMYGQPIARAERAGVAMPLTRMLAGQLEFLAHERGPREGPAGATTT
jgi:ketopantoate reductase